MYYFKENSLYCNKKILFKNIIPWVNTKIQPWEQDYKDKIYLDFKNSDEKNIYFESEGGHAKLTLTLFEENNSFILKAEGGYDDLGLMGHGHHLNSLCSLGFDFTISHVGNYVSGFMSYLFWQHPFVSDKLSKLKDRTQALLYKNKEENVCLITLCDKMFKTELFACKGNRISLVACSNTLCDQINEHVLIGAVGENEYDLSQQAVAYGLKRMQKKGALRKNKKYPEVFEYLGWCSWDAFQHHVTTEKLLDKCQEFKDKNIPVRWAILDDTWNDVTNIDNETKQMRELNDFEAAPQRFPLGLKDCITRIKENYGLTVGIWHPISGYWYGINPNASLAKRIPELLEYTIPGFYPDGPRLMHSYDKKKIEKYYDYQYKFYKDCGGDFVKVDNQGSTMRFSYFKGGIGETSKNLHEAVEKATKKYFNKTIINCMGMPNENFWNRTYSNVNRFSGDFLPEDRLWFIDHLLQCSYNSLFQSTLFTGDWDMFWSDDAQAKKNSVLRALSGGPIYVSDKLDRSKKEIIMPLVFSDGRILRFENPPKITKDCLFEDARQNKKIFKLFNTFKDTGVLTAFNLDKNEEAVTGEITVSDMGLKQGKYVIYDWFNETVTRDEKISLTLNNYDDFRLLIYAPVKNGKAVLGLKEKYLMPKTFKKISGGIEVLECGTLLVYSETQLNGFNKEQDNLYSKKVEKGEKVFF